MQKDDVWRARVDAKGSVQCCYQHGSPQGHLKGESNPNSGYTVYGRISAAEATSVGFQRLMRDAREPAKAGMLTPADDISR